MAVKKTKTLAEVEAVTTVTDSLFVPLADENGNLVRVSVETLRAALMDGASVASFNDGVFVVYHRKNNNYVNMVKPDLWPALQESGEIAEGVAVVEGGRILVVSPTEGIEGGTGDLALYWSGDNIAGGGTSTGDRLAALNDWTGQTSTAAQVTHAECSGENFAPGYCRAYSRTNANGQGLYAGRWWLPSVGELMMMYANLRKINHAISLIDGGKPIKTYDYWSSTEYGADNVWRVNFGTGAVGITGKRNYCSVRPVTAFLN